MKSVHTHNLVNGEALRVDIEGPTEIILQIDGLVDRGDGTFALRGVKPIDISHEMFETLTQDLMASGVHRNLAGRLVEEAYDSINRGLLADAIAQRTRRVG